MDHLNMLGERILEVNRANGWEVATATDWPDRVEFLATKLALIHSEVSEALEALRNNDRDNFEEELADVIIRVLDLAAGLEIHLDRAVNEKIKANRKRGYHHGGKAV